MKLHQFKVGSEILSYEEWQERKIWIATAYAARKGSKYLPKEELLKNYMTSQG